MGEEVKMSEYEAIEEDNNGDDQRVSEWEIGLPTGDDLTPLSQLLIPPELASAFSISPEANRTPLDVSRASQTTLSNLRSAYGGQFKPFVADDPTTEGSDHGHGSSESGSDPTKVRKIESEDGSGERTVKRQRLVWTPQLHKRFVDVVAHLGIKNAVPKTIMQMMNVEGLTRENVASHLQKYRLYLKRVQQGFVGAGDGPSSSDQLFASTPVPQTFRESAAGAGAGNGHMGSPAAAAIQYNAMPTTVYGHAAADLRHGNVWVGNGYGSGGSYPNYYPYHHHPYHHPPHVGSNDDNM